MRRVDWSLLTVCTTGLGLLAGVSAPPTAFAGEPHVTVTANKVASPTPATAGAAKPAAGRTDWHTDFETARAEAERLNLPLVAHFYSDWCGPCRAMEASVLNTAEVKAAFGTRCVGVKVNVGHDTSVGTRYGVAALPTDVFLSPTGTVLSRAVGGSDRSGYVARIERVGREFAGAQPDPLALLTKLADGGGVGLEGYSPVALTADKLWKKGSPEFAWKHGGVMYHLTDAAELARFKADPDKYALRYSGFDPLILATEKIAIAGDIAYGTFYHGRLHLHVSEENRQAFLKAPKEFPLPADIKPAAVVARRPEPVEAGVPAVAGT